MSALIYTKLHAIQSEIGKLRMEGVGPSTQGSYKYLKVDTILENLAPLLEKHGVVMLPKLVELRIDRKYGQEPPVEIEPQRWSGRIPTTSIHEHVIFDFHFFAIEDGSEFVVRSAGEAKSNDDKGVNKATRAAQKNALIQTFSIVTGEPDSEAFDRDDETRNEPKQNAAQQKIAKARTSTSRGVTTTEVPPVSQATTTAVDTDDDSKGPLRTRLRELQGEHSLTMAQVKFIGGEVTGEVYGKWFTGVRTLKKVIEALESDTERERLLNLAATGETA